MATKLPDNELIGNKRSSGDDATAGEPRAEARTLDPQQPRHADAANRLPDPATSATNPQIKAGPEPLDHPQAAQADAALLSKSSDAEQAPTAPRPATNAASNERAEIARRIAAFRKLQNKLKQDRESYFDETMAQTRKLLSRQAKP